VTERLSFHSGGERCAALLFRPPGGGSPPCIVLGHGFGAVKEGRPDSYADRFAAAGYAALAFDYRGFGESGGEPRQLVSVRRQHQDWDAAIHFARGLEGVDPDRIAIWGSSYGGGHVIAVASRHPELAAAIAQVPHTSAVATARSASPGNTLKLTARGALDLAGAALRRAPRYVPIVAPSGELGAMTTPDALPGYSALYPPGFEWRNEVLARSVLATAAYSPGRRARRVQCPLLVQVASADVTTPPEPARKAARRAPRGELVEYEGLGHFDVYVGEPFERTVADQLDFLRRHVPV
jgi:fermentation-respiration switch protein FrsA (DUF1100 family)